MEDIMIPTEMVESHQLSLEEIGAIVVLMCIPNMEKSSWITDDQFKKVLLSLKEKEIVNFHYEEDGVNIEIDLVDK